MFERDLFVAIVAFALGTYVMHAAYILSLIHISEPTRPY